MNNKLTFKHLRLVLLGLGFSETSVSGSGLMFGKSRPKRSCSSALINPTKR